MKQLSHIVFVMLLLLAGCSNEKNNRFYANNPEPLTKNAYIGLPLGAVRPEGWLLRQLQIQAEGLTGHLDDFWPDLVNSAWKGGEGEAWERGPYFLDGLVPVAFLLDDKRLKEKVQHWIESIISTSTDSGWYGPAKNKDRWPLAVANKVLMQYYGATGDKRALDVLLKYYRYLHDNPPDWPAKDWRGVRAMENAVTGYWLYRLTGEPWLVQTMESIQKNSPDWTSYYETFPWDSAASAEKRIPLNWGPDGLTAHVVNNAMAIKYPGLWYQQSGDDRFRKAVSDGILKYDINHGQAGGRFSGDEHLSGKSPDRGTELCAVVEYMFSLGELFKIFGDNTLADRLELLTYNSLPGTTTADMWAHQYDQQSNQVLVTVDKRNWSTNRDQSNIYGLMPNFACCLANMHQGWPKYIQNMWMATNDNGLMLTAYGPSSVTAKVGRSTTVRILEETDYPFNGSIKLTIHPDKPSFFPVYLRIPSWANGTVTWKDKTEAVKPGSTLKLEGRWKSGEQILIDFQMPVRLETRYNNSVSVLRGPLYFALRIEKEYKSKKLSYDNFGYMGSIDWEIYPSGNWNYSLMIDRNDPSRGIEIIYNGPGTYPFGDRGDMVWSADSGRYIGLTEDAAVLLKVRGFPVPGWTIRDNSADVPPFSPVNPSGDPEGLTLLPYGSAKLRITEFPVADIVFMKDIEKPR